MYLPHLVRLQIHTKQPLAAMEKRTLTPDAKPTKQGEKERSASVKIIVLSSMVLRHDH